MERIDKEILNDEIDDTINEFELKKKKRKRRKKRRLRLFILCIVTLLIFYFISDLSKVKQLSVVGNTIYSDDEILAMADLNYETRYVVVPAFWISSSIKKGEFIEDVKVIKNWSGGIRIEVKEVDLLGYYVDGEGNTQALARDGRSQAIQGTRLSLIAKLPLLHGFNEEGLQRLAQGFNTKEAIEVTILQQISEITPYATSYDPNMFKIVMADGNILYSSFDSLYLINDYTVLMSKVVKPNQCYYLEGVNRSYNSLPCEQFNK